MGSLVLAQCLCSNRMGRCALGRKLAGRWFKIWPRSPRGTVLICGPTLQPIGSGSNRKKKNLQKNLYVLSSYREKCEFFLTKHCCFRALFISVSRNVRVVATFYVRQGLRLRQLRRRRCCHHLVLHHLR